MNAISVGELVKQYPQSWKALLDWYCDQISMEKTGIEAVDKNLEQLPGKAEPILKNLLDNVIPRFLYDFFDAYNVWVIVSPSSVGNWNFSIITSSGVVEFDPSPPTYMNRPKAEVAAFVEAFRVLQQYLIGYTDE